MGDRTPIQQLKGIGEKTAKLFYKLHIGRCPILFHFFCWYNKVAVKTSKEESDGP